MAALITIPALVEVNIGTDDAPIIVPTAFYAVVSIGVIGLYTAFAIPIYLRWRAGDTFKQGKWNLGTKWKWMAPVAVIEIAIISVYFILPFTPAANPFNEAFEWKFVNYAPILIGGALLALWIGWHLSAKKWFTGPKMTIDLPEGVTGADEIALEHHGKTAHGGEAHDWKPGDPLGLSGSTVSDLEQLLDGIPVLTGQGRHVTPLPGGLTNTNYRVRTDAGLDVVVRVSAPETGLLGVDRHCEHVNTLAAAAAGVGAPVVDYLEGRGVMVVGFLPGRTWIDADVDANLPTAGRRGAADCTPARAFVGRFDMFALRRCYLGIVRERGFRMPPGYAALEPFAERVEQCPRPGSRAARAVPQRPARRERASTTAATCGSSTTSTRA